MPISEKVVGEVVKEASTKMTDPRFAQTLVGSWVQAQPAAIKYITAHARELGGENGVVNLVFHAALLTQCFLRNDGRTPRAMSFADLDAVASGDTDAALGKRQPALRDYLLANVEHEETRKVLTLIALAMDLVS